MSVLFRLEKPNLNSHSRNRTNSQIYIQNYTITHIRFCLPVVVRGLNDQKLLTVFKIIPSNTNGATRYKVTS